PPAQPAEEWGPVPPMEEMWRRTETTLRAANRGRDTHMRGKYPPGPRDGLFGIQLYRSMQADPLQFTIDVARQHGDYPFDRFGWVRMYFVNRPELIREVLTTKVKSFPKLRRQMKALHKIEGDGLVVSDGASWARHRPVVQGSFHARHMRAYSERVVEH